MSDSDNIKVKRNKKADKHKKTYDKYGKNTQKGIRLALERQQKTTNKNIQQNT
jgi:hypothetical protein